LIDDWRILEAHSEPIRTFAFDRTSTKLAAVDDAGRLVVWSVHDGAVLATHELRARSRLRDHLDFAPDGRLLAAISDDVTLHDARSLDVLAKARAPSLGQYTGDHAFAGFGAGGELVLVGHRLYDGRTLELLAEAATEEVPEVRWPFACIDPDGDAVLLYDSAYDGSGRAETGPWREPHLTLFGPDLRTIRRRSFETPDRWLTFDRAARRFVFGRQGGAVVAWTTDGREERVIATLEEIPLFVYPLNAAIIGYPGTVGRHTFAWWRGSFDGERFEVELPKLAAGRPSPDGRWLAWPIQKSAGFSTPKMAIADISSLSLPR